MAADVAEIIWYSEDSTTPLTITKPAAFSPGNVLIAVIAQHANPSSLSDFTAQTGWVDEGNYNGTISQAKVWSYIYTGSDPATWDFGYKATADVCLALIRVVNAEPSMVINVAGSPTASMTSSYDSLTITPTGVNDLLITLLANHGNTSPASSTEPSGMDDLGQVQVSSLYMSLAASKEQLVSSSATGARTWTSVSPTGHTGGSLSITVQSAPDPPPDPSMATPWIPPSLLWQLLTARGMGNVGVLPPVGPYVAGTYVSWQSDGTNNGNGITTDTKPQTGDYLVVCVTDSQSATPPVAPAGWTEIFLPDTDSGTNFEVHCYFLKNPAVSTTYTWTVTGGRRTVVGALVRGASATTPFDAASSLETGTGTPHASPVVTTAGTDRLLMAFNVLREFPTPKNGWLQATGWVENAQAFGADATTNMVVSLQTRPAPISSAYSDTFTSVAGEPAIVVLLSAQAVANPIPAPARPRRVFVPPRRARAISVVPAQVVTTPPASIPAGIRPQIKQYIAHRAHTATPVIPVAAPVAPAYVPQTLHARVKALWSRRRPAAAQPVVQPAVPQPSRGRLRPVRVQRPGRSTPIPAQPTPPAATSPTLRLARLWRGRPATPVPPQATVPPPAYPPVGIRSHVKFWQTWRSHGAIPVPAQVVVAPPAYPPTGVKARLRGWRPWRSRTATLVPAQAAVAAPNYPPMPARQRARAIRPARDRQSSGPIPAQANPPAPARRRWTVIGKVAPARKPRTAAPPAPQAAPPLVARIKLRFAKAFRGKTRQPVPAQVILIAPAYPPPPTRARRQAFTNRRRRATGDGWLIAHSCSTPRPTTGTTSRPTSGVTVYNPARTTRPSSGITTRPDTGVTEDPC